MDRVKFWRGVPCSRHLLGGVSLLVCSSMLLPQCNPGGLDAQDFVLLSENGFDASDHDDDNNEYAWSMRYFRPDGDKSGTVYVGTGNNISGIFTYYAEANLSGGETDNPPVLPPEIRRHRPDLGEDVWEKVLDYRDIDDDLKTYGFRSMIVYDAESETQKGALTSYLYAGSQGVDGSTLWRSSTGDAGTWESVFTSGPNSASMRALAVHDGKLYVGFAFDALAMENPPAAEIWVSENGVGFEPVMQDGFGDPNNRAVEFLMPFDGWLFAGTKNDVDGYEVWKLDGPGDQDEPVQVVDNGGPDSRNESAGTAFVFKEKLYVGSLIFYGYNRIQNNGFKGCDIIRIDTDDSWETVVGPRSVSGYNSGFNYFTNAYCWQFEEHDGWLYTGTFDQATLLAGLLDNLPAIIALLQEQNQKAALGEFLDFDDWMRLMEGGGDIFKTQDGENWFRITSDGLGNRGNYGWRTMESTPDGHLYLGSANPTNGLEIWRTVEPLEE
ncbi:MAG TPA: hypothetical protein PLJ47_07100 [Candidatus Hydrogenedentes bacterium]|nr:hypothetical protein [Candidatus Hydrogenedentota bacterium]HRK34346.1 hypothetical protein [Candidatus Hydrogenedentota bacterium]